MWGAIAGLVLAAALAAFVMMTPGTRDGLNSVSKVPIELERGMTPETAAALARLEARERTVDSTVWAPEMEALRLGGVVEDWWDAINASTSKLASIRSLPIPRVVFPQYAEEVTGPLGVRIAAPLENGTPLDGYRWRDRLDGWLREGLELARVELRQERYEPGDATKPARSWYRVAVHVLRRGVPEHRFEFDGTMAVSWASSSKEKPSVTEINLAGLQMRFRVGDPGFARVQEWIVPVVDNVRAVDPVLVEDLDGNGFPDLVWVGANRIQWNRGSNRFEAGVLCQKPSGEAYSALLGDFDGDGKTDCLAQRFQGLVLFRGTSVGASGSAFPELGTPVWDAPKDVRYPMVLASGDVDRDGDMDVLMGQYRVPFEDGNMPTPFHDARDGYPMYLLLNDGDGRFRDGTPASGIGAKRNRRMYSASLVQLDGDGLLDLLVVSDFAGLDLYRGDGRGHFVDVTDRWTGESRAFGMGHVFGDFDADGSMDFLMMGMTSPTADRLEHLGLVRRDAGAGNAFRRAMSAGNRLYFGGREGGGFQVRSLGASAARTGWTWGAGVLDVDNDGWSDLHVANGHESRATVKDYEGEYWRHDLFVGRSESDSIANEYFKRKLSRSRASGESYGGFERNRLLMNREGREFIEAGYLMGVAIPEDARNVVAADLDGDGGQDLVVTGYESWPGKSHWVRVFRNVCPDRGGWIGIQPEPLSPGVVVRLEAGGRGMETPWTTGDGYRTQRPGVLHFGLGRNPQADRITVRWPDGRLRTLESPAGGAIHRIRAAGD